MEKVSKWLLKADCPFCSITGDRKVTAKCVAMRMSLIRWHRGWVTGSLGESAGTLHGRVAALLRGRTVSERAATLHERDGLLGALCALHDTGLLCV